jgi:hypothetical protein
MLDGAEIHGCDLSVAGDGSMTDQDPRWLARVTKDAVPTTTATAAKSPQDVAHEPPRAEVPMYQPKEIRSWKKKVHIKDTNYTDEYLGYVELLFEAYLESNGQVYVRHALATKNFIDRGRDYLSIGANVSSHSVDLNGERFADVFFDVQIGGPNKTETTAVGLNGKVTGSNSDKSKGAELGASVVFSSAVSSQGTAAFRRVFRISSLDVAELAAVPDPKTNEMRPKATNMSLAERGDMHSDFSDFELDDDDVGDGAFSFYANWVLHSYSD